MKKYVVSFRNGSSRVVKAKSHQHTFTRFKGSGYSEAEETLELLGNNGGLYTKVPKKLPVGVDNPGTFL